ncbi:conserved hypothetical protein [Neospora caninum Liverpool]|uniref:Uncharacterized protein n=1 Tax=Neospora caninum (strain Liverpool) TaxID=572307 RepID=F0V9R8_NEOCL|nr:conserved hypothetical protein [Neospora caninum Liverpool]CBZ50229.1 conserved hypothetical protein [Neospora caninum Liverpool]CEL64830.1 TPA: hypothetical protein BN1204_007040 [Neospora caninum Liverpool]|eukprot:XP_003880264.1 conserved hypothetical protein [Neospora caninum Liverpool]
METKLLPAGPGVLPQPCQRSLSLSPLLPASDRLRWKDLSQAELLSDLEEISLRAAALWEVSKLTSRDGAQRGSAERQETARDWGTLDEHFAKEVFRLAGEAIQVAREKENQEKAREEKEDGVKEENEQGGDEEKEEGGKAEREDEKEGAEAVSLFFEVNAMRQDIAQEAVDLSLSVDLLRLSLLSAASRCLSSEKQAEAWRLASVSTVASGVCTPPDSGMLPVQEAKIADRERFASHFRRVCTLRRSDGRRADEAFESFWMQPTCCRRPTDALQREALARARPSAAGDLVDFWHRLLRLPSVCFRHDAADLFSASALPQVAQDAKDAQRDSFLLNGSFVSGADGFARLLTRLHDILRPHARATLDSVLEALLILHLQNRTYTGGSSVDFLFPLLSLPPLCLLVPLPTNSMHNQLVTVHSPSNRHRLSSSSPDSSSSSPDSPPSSPDSPPSSPDSPPSSPDSSPSSPDSSSSSSSPSHLCSKTEGPVGVQLHAHIQYCFHVAASDGVSAEAPRNKVSLSSIWGGSAERRGSSLSALLGVSKKRKHTGQTKEKTETEERKEAGSKEALSKDTAQTLLEKVTIDVHWFGSVNLERLRRAHALHEKIKDALHTQTTQNDKARSIWEEVTSAFAVDADMAEAAKTGAKLPAHAAESSEDGLGNEAEPISQQCIYLKINAREIWENYLKAQETEGRKEKQRDA